MQAPWIPLEKQLRNWFLTLFLCTESGVLYSLHLPCLSVGSQQESVYCVPMPAFIWVPGTKNRLVVVCCQKLGVSRGTDCYCCLLRLYQGLHYKDADVSSGSDGCIDIGTSRASKREMVFCGLNANPTHFSCENTGPCIATWTYSRCAFLVTYLHKHIGNTFQVSTNHSMKTAALQPF